METQPSLEDNDKPPQAPAAQTASQATPAAQRGWWTAAKHELSRKTEQSVFIILIMLDKMARAVLGILVGTGLLDLLHSMAPIQFLQQLINEIYLTSISRSLEMQLENLAHLTHGTLIRLAIGAYGYAALEMIEGVGLLKRRRWAEYLTLVATLIPIPFIEIPELAAKFTLIRLGALLINIAIVIYLIIARKLFRAAPAENAIAGQALLEQSQKHVAK